MSKGAAMVIHQARRDAVKQHMARAMARSSSVSAKAKRRGHALTRAQVAARYRAASAELQGRRLVTFALPTIGGAVAAAFFQKWLTDKTANRVVEDATQATGYNNTWPRRLLVHGLTPAIGAAFMVGAGIYAGGKPGRGMVGTGVFGFGLGVLIGSLVRSLTVPVDANPPTEVV